jgi:hypothetical protein
MRRPEEDNPVTANSVVRLLAAFAEFTLKRIPANPADTN